MQRNNNCFWRRNTGQGLTESVMLLPLFLALVFALLQVCHLGVAVAVVHYATSSVAGLAVQNNDAKLSSGSYQTRFSHLLLGGLIPVGQPTAQSDPSEDRLTPTVTITACAKLPAYPLVGETLKTFMSSTIEAGETCSDNPKAFGPVRMAGTGPYSFIIRAQTTVRLNYQP